tara:strand:+ start:147 stop:911 length:765 start_codon:yes stop_codon:yes gene_type:complete
MNNVFSKYGIPKNMGNQEIKRRVKYSNWVGSKFRLYGPAFYEYPGQSMNAKMKKYENRYAREKKGSLNTYTKFLMNDKILTENKRKDLVVLALQLGGNARGVLAVRNPVIVSYLMKLVSLYGNYYPEEFTGQLKSFGKYREDAAMISVLKKRINFLKRLKNYGPIPNFVPNNIRNNLEPVLQKLNIKSYNSLNESRLKKLMDEIFPIPPHPKGNTAAKTIQKRARGMINRTTVKKMKTVAGRVTLRGKRKRSPQ